MFSNFLPTDKDTIEMEGIPIRSTGDPSEYPSSELLTVQYRSSDDRVRNSSEKSNTIYSTSAPSTPLIHNSATVEIVKESRSSPAGRSRHRTRDRDVPLSEAVIDSGGLMSADDDVEEDGGGDSNNCSLCAEHVS